MGSSSMSIKFLTNKFLENIGVNISLSVFYRVFPNFNEEKEHIKIYYPENNDIDKFDFAGIWERKDIVLDKIVFNSNSDSKIINLKDYVSDIADNSNLFFENIKIPREFLTSEEKYNEFVSNHKGNGSNLNWEIKLSIKTINFTQNGENLKLSTLHLDNAVVGDTSSKLVDSTIFSPILNVDFGENNLFKFDYEYVHEGYERYYSSYLRCINCQGEYDKDSNSFITKPYAEFLQDKITPISYIDNVDLSFDTLSKPEGITELKKLSHLMLDFVDTCDIDVVDDYLKDEYGNNLDNFKNMIKRFNDGVSLLENDSNVEKAFYLMNKTFDKNSQGKYNSWRVFQIVFIVMLLSDTISNDTKDTCDLLHVMTGGGKSETYFGIVIFSAFYDRLIGKNFGITAITKFPLRMLSIQQLQRVANLFIWAEEIRLQNELGGENFSIAYFVGNNDEFPGNNYELISKIKNDEAKSENTPGKIINKCPICEDHGDVILVVNDENSTIIHKCTSCGREFKLYFTDDEIYRMLPTFIISTVDKLAGFAQNRRFKNLFGGKLDKCPVHGFYPKGDKCSYKITKNQTCEIQEKQIQNFNFSTAPSLMIQDELHLIREGFGTIDSHFESLFETLQYKLSGTSFKRIGMTATVTGADKQIKHLYDKDVVVFPPKIENSMGENFFFKKETNSDGQSKVQRKIIGILPNMSRIPALVHILRYLGQFYKNVEENIEEFAEENNFNLEDLKEILIYYKQVLTYHRKKNETHSIDYYADSFINNREDSYNIDPVSLTGESNIDDIKEIINKAENYHSDGKNQSKIFTVNATSIVSHGVDIDNWNFMLINGMPGNTSEYIQALSRIGRKNYGVVFLSFMNRRTRDISFYQHFTEYHGILEDKVEIVALSRWTKLGFKQTFTSIFLGSILNYMSDVLERPIYQVKHVKEVFNENEENCNLLIEFLRDAYLTNTNSEIVSYFDEAIPSETKDRLKTILSYGTSDTNSDFIRKAIEDNDNKYYNVQMGMRGIQDEIRIVASAANESSFRAQWKG